MGDTSNDSFDNMNGLFTYYDSWTLREDFIFDAVLYTMKSLIVLQGKVQTHKTRCGGCTCFFQISWEYVSAQKLA